MVGSSRLSHIDHSGRPAMVDVGSKRMTRRQATACAEIVFPAAAAAALHAAELRSKKGPVLDTAIIAGTMAVKRTHELIPFCHPLLLDAIRFEYAFVEPARLRLLCTVSTLARTGVEMEALTGVSIAALTVYDMCKSLSLGMRIDAIQVLRKAGGKRDFDVGKAPAKPRPPRRRRTPA